MSAKFGGAASTVSKERESLGAGAAGGAALGAVIGLGIVSTSVVVPLLGAVIGAMAGTGVGHLLNAFKTRRPPAESDQNTLGQD